MEPQNVHALRLPARFPVRLGQASPNRAPRRQEQGPGHMAGPAGRQTWFLRGRSRGPATRALAGPGAAGGSLIRDTGQVPQEGTLPDSPRAAGSWARSLPLTSCAMSCRSPRDTVLGVRPHLGLVQKLHIFHPFTLTRISEGSHPPYAQRQRWPPS